ncbi:fasciclin domain-containing protein [Algoriphagus antarcticus]|uniref:Putative surface protein with fasciclin (FAS1) repeats n=1 Tax=Algoriphagus antarcticus TaxID=238540 RepID=A0A3E0DMJ5_9BACT|nr:fasciclin domain-containing protein [Algoriphagus antarcticus]REG84053.1 putative surface protein with fasciclin (FAS1) repeats [Algoriphagus antarcticus]
MKKLGTVMMLMLLVVASSFTMKTSTVHETRFDADIVDLAASQDMLSTLVAAVKAAGLVETLKGDGPFTVFAPTNEAFAKLPEGTVEDLLKPENKAQLAKILSYHVVAGKVMSTDLKNGQMAKTVEGSEVKVTLMNGKAMINNANVIKADVMADNGVVHIIDTVIMPPM